MKKVKESEMGGRKKKGRRREEEGKKKGRRGGRIAKKGEYTGRRE